MRSRKHIDHYEYAFILLKFARDNSGFLLKSKAYSIGTNAAQMRDILEKMFSCDLIAHAESTDLVDIARSEMYTYRNRQEMVQRYINMKLMSTLKITNKGRDCLILLEELFSLLPCIYDS